jgi:hypothetical protein
MFAPTGRSVRLLLLTTVTSVAGFFAGSPASAAPQDNPDDTWMTNGPVRSVARWGDTIFLGGEFTQLRENPPGQGGGVIEVQNLAAISAVTGGPVPGLDLPEITGPNRPVVWSLTTGGGKLFVGGRFTAVDGVTRKNLAAVNAVTGAFDPSFVPRLGIVLALETDGTTLFAGGRFLTVNGKPRERLAAMSLQGALRLDWAPGADAVPRDMALTPDQSRLFVAGEFEHVTNLGGATHERDGIVLLDPASGSVEPWVAGCPCSVTAWGIGIDVTSTRVYVGMGGSDWVASWDINTGDQIWRTDTNGSAQDVVVFGDRVMVGGHFKFVAPAPYSGYDCFHQPEECHQRLRIAALDLNGNLDLGWDAPLIGAWRGVERMLATATQLYVGGEFTKVSSENHTYIARFSAD